MTKKCSISWIISFVHNC